MVPIWCHSSCKWSPSEMWTPPLHVAYSCYTTPGPILCLSPLCLHKGRHLGIGPLYPVNCGQSDVNLCTKNDTYPRWVRSPLNRSTRVLMDLLLQQAAAHLLSSADRCTGFFFLHPMTSQCETCKKKSYIMTIHFRACIGVSVTTKLELDKFVSKKGA